MKSMTGFGSSDSSLGGTKISVQISSVNRKQTELRVMLPRDLFCLERNFRERIKKAVSRGAINVKVELDVLRGGDDCVSPDIELSRSLYNGLKALKEDLHLEGAISISDILRIPNMDLFKKQEMPIEKISELSLSVLDKALEELIASKILEGNSLQKDLKKRHETLLDIVEKIGELAPDVPIQYQKKMASRVQERMDTIQLDDERIYKEVALFADRCDISEEITRISSHLSQMKTLINSVEPVGRKLDFLIQEIFREINTIGTKANNVEISTHVINFKTELERIREQVQNIE